ncbi:MAG: hypothetical protein ACMUIP_03405 [bacterium]
MNKSKNRHKKKDTYLSATNQLIKLIRDDEPFVKEPEDATTKIIDLGITEYDDAYGRQDFLPILYQGKLHKGDNLIYLGVGILLLIIITFVSTWIFSTRLKKIQEKNTIVLQQFEEQTRYIENIPTLEEKKQLLANIENNYNNCLEFQEGIVSIILKELTRILPSNIIPRKISIERSTSILSLEGLFLKNKSSKFRNIDDVANIINNSSLFNKARIIYQYPDNAAKLSNIVTGEATNFCLEFIYSKL